MEWSLHQWHLLLFRAFMFHILVWKFHVVALLSLLNWVALYHYAFLVTLLIAIFNMIIWYVLILRWLPISRGHSWLLLWRLSNVRLSRLRVVLRGNKVIDSAWILIWVTNRDIKVVNAHLLVLRSISLVDEYAYSYTQTIALLVVTSRWLSIILVHNPEVLID
jgi:hypothetical protein